MLERNTLIGGFGQPLKPPLISSRFLFFKIIIIIIIILSENSHNIYTYKFVSVRSQEL